MSFNIYISFQASTARVEIGSRLPIAQLLVYAFPRTAGNCLTFFL